MMISSEVIGTDRDHDLSQTDALIMKLYTVVLDYHYGVNTTRPFNETHDRDKRVMDMAKQYFKNRALGTESD